MKNNKIRGSRNQGKKIKKRMKNIDNKEIDNKINGNYIAGFIHGDSP